VAAVVGTSRGAILHASAGEGAFAEDGVVWRVPVTVTNDGDEAALSVLVEASASVHGTEEVAELIVDLVPQGGSRVALVFLLTGTPDGPVQARVLGYERP
jgi:hypothetical protein